MRLPREEEDRKEQRSEGRVLGAGRCSGPSHEDWGPVTTKKRVTGFSQISAFPNTGSALWAVFSAL